MMMTSPYPPEIDAHVWRGLRRVDGTIKLGVMLRHTDRAPQWVARLLNLLIAEPAIKLDVVYHVAGLPDGMKNTAMSRIVGRNRTDSAAPVEVPISVKPACCFVDVAYEPGLGFAEDSQVKIRKRKLDVLLWLDDTWPSGTARDLARLGLWSFTLAPLTNPKTELFTSEAVASHITLIQHQEHLERGRVIATHARRLSAKSKWDALTDIAAPLFIRSLLNALQGRAMEGEEITSPPEETLPSKTSDAITLVKSLVRSKTEIEAPRKHQKTSWSVAIRPELHGSATYCTEGGFMEIPKPADRDYSEPFILKHDGRDFVFFKNSRKNSGLSLISAVEIVCERETGPAFTALGDASDQFSYPCVFEDRGEIFMIPTTPSSLTIGLYRARSFPNDWEHVTNLVEGISAINTTPFHLDGMWYFFTSTADAETETFLFYSQRLDEKWSYHPANPIASDARRASSAGAVFRPSGKLIRPVQDRAADGRNVVAFNEITRLTPAEYQEHCVKAMQPGWQSKLAGTNTFNSNEWYEVIDTLHTEEKP
jgi:hypothetical protein